jgi:hypothetical protein
VVGVGVGLALTLGEADLAPDEADLLGEADLSGEADLLGEAAGDPLLSGEVVGSAAVLFDEQAEMAAQASKARRTQPARASLARNPVLAVGCPFMRSPPMCRHTATRFTMLSDHEANAHLRRIYANGCNQYYLVQSVVPV